MYRNYYLKDRTLYLRSKVVVEKRDEYESYLKELEVISNVERIKEMKQRVTEDIKTYYNHLNNLISILHSLIQLLLDQCNEKLNLPNESVEDYVPKIVYRSL